MWILHNRRNITAWGPTLAKRTKNFRLLQALSSNWLGETQDNRHKKEQQKVEGHTAEQGQVLLSQLS